MAIKKVEFKKLEEVLSTRKDLNGTEKEVYVLTEFDSDFYMTLSKFEEKYPQYDILKEALNKCSLEGPLVCLCDEAILVLESGRGYVPVLFRAERDESKKSSYHLVTVNNGTGALTNYSISCWVTPSKKEICYPTEYWGMEGDSFSIDEVVKKNYAIEHWNDA